MTCLIFQLVRMNISSLLYFMTDLIVEERPAVCQILLLLEEGGPRPLTFVLNTNLVVNVKLVTCMFEDCISQST